MRRQTGVRIRRTTGEEEKMHQRLEENVVAANISVYKKSFSLLTVIPQRKEEGQEGRNKVKNERWK